MRAVIEDMNELAIEFRHIPLLEKEGCPLLEKGINILDASCGRANSPPQLRRGGRDIKKISRSLLIRSGQGGAGQ